ncbi:MAG: hypothetical protein JWN70_567 [Planctomycetaceae bacterium]|nr:hypothetical protein [Planctomycetaceae bacterium]
MADQLKVECPHCKEALPLKDRSADGKKARCPKCKEVFRVQLPAILPAKKSLVEDIDLEAYFSDKDSGNEKSAAVDSVTEDSAAANSAIASVDVANSAAANSDGEASSAKDSTPLGSVTEKPSADDSASDNSDVDKSGAEDAEDEDAGAEKLTEGEPIKTKETSPEEPSLKAKNKEKSGKSKFPRAIMAIAAVALLTLGGMVVVVGKFTGNEGSNKIDMTYLLPDANLVAQLKVKEMLESPLLAGVMNTPAAQQMLEMHSSELGVDAKEVISLTVGAKIDERVPDRNSQSGSAEKVNAPDETQQASHRVTVIRTSVVLRADEITATKLKATQQTHNGKTYYKLAAVPENRLGIKPSQTRPDSVYFPEPSVMVMASEADLKLVIDQGATQTRRREFDFINPGMTLLMAMAMQSAGDPNAALKTPEDQPQLQALERATNRAVRGGVAGIKITDHLDLEVIAKCADNARAAEMKAALDGLFTHLKSQFVQSKVLLAQLEMNDVIALADKSLSSLKVEVTDSQVVALGTIPSGLKSVGESLSKKMPGMAEMGIPLLRVPVGSDASQVPPKKVLPGTVSPERTSPGTVPPPAVPTGAVPPAGAPPP